MDPIQIDVEEPHQEITTMPLAQAIETYMLDETDVKALRDNQVVWYKDVALSLHRNEE